MLIDTHWRRWLALGLGLSLLGCGTDEPELAKDSRAQQCVRVRDNAITQRLRATGAPPEDRKVLEQSLGPSFLDGCAKLSDPQVECALQASSLDELSACAAK